MIWFKQLSALVHARNLEFFRDKSALSWNILFPFLMILAIGFAFSDWPKDLFKVGVLGENTKAPIIALDYIKQIPVESQEKGIKLLNEYVIDLLIDPQNKSYWVNENSREGYFLDKVIQQSPEGLLYTPNRLAGNHVRYIDWVFFGILVINMMYSCLYGVGYVIVRYRKNGHLKRLQATPISVFQFLTAQVISRIFVVNVVMMFVFGVCYFFVKPHFVGNIFLLILMSFVGSLCFISLGLVLCSRVSSEELSRGLIEIVSWPMLFLSGAWFSLEGAHISVQKIAQIFPATHFIDGLRAIALYNASLIDVLPQIIILLAMSVVFLGLGSVWFKWQSK